MVFISDLIPSRYAEDKRCRNNRFFFPRATAQVLNGLKAGIASLDNILLRFMQERRILRVVKAQIPEALDRMSTWC